MIYPVRIFDKHGQLIKVVSSEEMLQKIWGKIEAEVETVIAEDKDGKQKKAKTITCVICKTIVTKFSFTAKFCSHKCAMKVQNDKRKAQREEIREPRPCRKCGKFW